MENPRLKVIIALILAAGLIRILPHPPQLRAHGGHGRCSPGLTLPAQDLPC